MRLITTIKQEMESDMRWLNQIIRGMDKLTRIGMIMGMIGIALLLLPK